MFSFVNRDPSKPTEVCQIKREGRNDGFSWLFNSDEILRAVITNPVLLVTIGEMFHY